MILPVYAYGQPVLKKVAKPIEPDYAELDKLIVDMWETMYHSDGVGLAAPQIGLPIRLFVVDTIQMQDEGETAKGVKEAFINAVIVEESGNPWAYEEGCLSIPGIRGEVMRQPVIRIRYQNEAFQTIERTFEGINARVIQHEYDHIQGVLFVEKLKPLKKRMIQKKLEKIKRGEADASYRLKFA